MIELVGGWIEAGGPIVVILGFMSLYSLTLIAVKTVQLAGAVGDRTAREEAIASWHAGERQAALARAAGGRTPADRLLAATMRDLESERPDGAVREEAERRGAREIATLSAHLRTLEVIAAVSPLLGLLGTVLGMIQSFQELELAAGAANATVLAGGIWQALLTTAMGLIVAIPAAVAASLIPGRLDRVAEAIEDAVTGLLAAHRAEG